MSTTGAYEFRLSVSAQAGVVQDENKIDRGEWAWIDRTAADRRWLSIYVRCPDCGFLATLWRSFGDEHHGHQIDANGNVSPSMGCPHNPCGFHTQPTLLQAFIDLRIK